MNANVTRPLDPRGTEQTGPGLGPAGGGNARSVLLRILAHGGYETSTAMRNGEQLLVSVIVPVLALVGIVWTGLLDTAEVRGVDVAVPGVLALAVISSAFTSQAIATGFDRRYHVLTYLATTPLGPAGLLAGKALAVMAVLLVQVMVIGGIGLLLGWRPDVSGLGWAVLFLAAGAVAFTALGLLIAGTARPEATLALTNLLWVLLGAVGGSVFPLPDWGPLAGFISLLPSAALGDGLRASLMEGGPELTALVVLLVWTLLAGAGVLRWFKWR